MTVPPFKATEPEREVRPDELKDIAARAEHKVFLVDNPVSGMGDSSARKETFLQHFDSHNWFCEVYNTSKGEDVTGVVRESLRKGFDLVVASGGDGTVAGVASGMVNSNVPMGIIPAGTGNMLARDLGIPLRPEQALDVITGSHDIVHMDAMRANGKIYLLNLGVGISSNVMARTPRKQKRRFGMAAYAWSAIAEVSGFKLRNFYLQVDDDHVSTFRASEILVVNSSVIGIQKVPPLLAFDPTDGRLDVCIIRARTALDLASLLVNAVVRGGTPNSKLRCMTAQDRIVIRSDRRLIIQADGEVIGKTPLEIKMLPGALRIITPFKEPSTPDRLDDD